MKKSVFSRLLPSLVVVLAAVVVQVSGKGLNIPLISMTDLGECAVVAAFFGLVYGFVRFDRASGAALFVAFLHDALLTFALTILAGLLLPRIAAVPYAIVTPAAMTMVVMMTLAQSMTVLRMCSKTSLSPSDAALKALKDSSRIRVMTMALPILVGAILVAAGGARLLPAVCPVLLAALVSVYSPKALTVPVWTAVSTMKGAR